MFLKRKRIDCYLLILFKIELKNNIQGVTEPRRMIDFAHERKKDITAKPLNSFYIETSEKSPTCLIELIVKKAHRKFENRKIVRVFSVSNFS